MQAAQAILTLAWRQHLSCVEHHCEQWSTKSIDSRINSTAGTTAICSGCCFAAAVALLLLQSMWADMADGFKAAVDSFTLVETTNAYIAPDQNPW
jgi:hypothetical protein